MSKTILITGGGSGIGQAIAWNFASAGFKVYIIGRRLDKLKETQELYPDLIEVIQADIAKASSHNMIKAAITEAKLDYLVHNAGIITPVTQFDKVSAEELQMIFATNVQAPILLTQKLLPKLIGSRVLHISSGLAHQPLHSTGPYCMSKAALYMTKEVMNLEFENTLVGSVMPGIVYTPIQTPLLTTKSMRDRDYFVAMKEKNHMLKPAQSAKFINYILLKTSDSDFIMGDWDIYETSHHELWLGDEELPTLL